MSDDFETADRWIARALVFALVLLVGMMMGVSR